MFYVLKCKRREASDIYFISTTPEDISLPEETLEKKIYGPFGSGMDALAIMECLRNEEKVAPAFGLRIPMVGKYLLKAIGIY
ncbi:hypothetical protein Desca_1014 [Desulfotomaculum nigrificans CO-1-SRB]|uniref:Uncharacterized protein n=1 Tax=Desulfotomaculum nigrificans (strain DSM 14880 / VKM B-2319 / CO-1-SRB) TaxID=868595 RepID=F6B2Q7_DESCC|nr:hypothetical protein [Desulfotomaculum nigrificans]AEF93886.1 hypothetical protein Desca_1014 [Desulfotomaculum nigrificans CO-1-SRB]